MGDKDFAKRATEFVESVLDALKNPDPEHLARRAQFLEQKEREDAETLANFHREVAAKQAALERAAKLPPPSVTDDVPPVRLAGTPRSVFELEFVADMLPCVHCGAYGEHRWKKVTSELTWFLEARCSTCQRRRAYAATALGDLLDCEPEPNELGNGPSTMFDAPSLIAEIERIGRHISKVDLPEPEHSANWARIVRIETALTELSKLVASTELEDRGRQWIALERARWERVSDALAPPARHT